MAKTLNKTGITTGNTVRAYHVTQSVDAFTGIDAYDITISGSLVVTGSQTTTGDIYAYGNITASGNISSSLQLLGKSLEIKETASIGRSLTVGTTLTVAETITGDGAGITNLQRPISNSVSTNFSASTSNSGFYFRAGGNVTCSIGTSSIYLVPIGVEYEIFQTSSAGNFSFVTGSSTIILNSKDGKTKLTGQFSAATLKKVGGDEWDLIGDLS